METITVEKVYRHKGYVSKSEFIKLNINADALFMNLIRNGYLNENGHILGEFHKIKSPLELELDSTFAGKREQIFAVLKQCQKSEWREWIESAFIALALVVFLRTFFFQIYKIPTNSMVPTLKPGDKIFVTKLVYGPKVPFTALRLPGFSKPERGEVVVFVPPNDRHKFYIKRLIGLANDKILIKDGSVYVNGKIIVDPRIARNYYYNDGDYASQTKSITVPAGKFFFMGDNSRQSLDSRFWGFVDERDIVGKALFVWWPPQRIGMVE